MEDEYSHTIKVKAYIGRRAVDVTLSRLPGGGMNYQVIVDKFYQGMISKGTPWKGHLRPGSSLTAEDIQVLGDIIDAAGEEKSPG